MPLQPSGLAALFSSYVGGFPHAQLGEHPRKDPELTGKIIYIVYNVAREGIGFQHEEMKSVAREKDFWNTVFSLLPL